MSMHCQGGTNKACADAGNWLDASPSLPRYNADIPFGGDGVN